jgi:hypothetical protein
MQTSKDSAHVHTTSLEGEEQALPDTQWRTGVRARFPWLGFSALLTILLCLASSVVVLLISNGKSQDHWGKKIAPNVIISGLNSLANLCFGVAIGNGVAITWWRKALKGATIQDLHRSWKFSSSIKEVVLGGKYFNVIALAALAAKLTIIDSMLLQRATETVLANDRELKRTVDTWYNTTMPYTAVQGGDGNDPILFDWFNKDVSNCTHNNGIFPNPGIDCDGVCNLEIPGTGFEIDCTTSEIAVDYGQAAFQDAVASNLSTDADAFNGTLYYTLFDITFYVLYADTDADYARIAMNITTSSADAASNRSCPGTLTQHNCILRPAVVGYPVTIEDNTRASLSSDSDTSSNTNLTVSLVSNMYLGYDSTSYGGQVYYSRSTDYNAIRKQQDGYVVHDYKDIHESVNSTHPNTTIGGLAKAFFQSFNGDSTMHFDLDKGFETNLQGSAGSTFLPPALSHNCDIKFQDPLNFVVQQINRIMFTLATDPWYLNPDNPWSSTDYDPDRNYTAFLYPLNETQTSTSIHYKTNTGYMFGAIASVLVCVLCVIPSYYGYWQLGHDVTLGPFEIANAFRAPVLDNPRATNAGVKALIKEVGGRQVKYGEMVQADAPGRLAIAEPEAVRRVHPRINDFKS